MATETSTRTTRRGAAVRDCLRDTGGFVSAQDVYARLRADGSTIGLATVYRQLQALVDDGGVDAIRGTDGETVYRVCAPEATHHHHLVCRDCGATVEVRGPAVEKWARSVAEENGYTDVDHTVELFGRCPACTAAQRTAQRTARR